MTPVSVAKSADQAMEEIASGLLYFFKAHPKKTSLALLVIAGCALFVVFHYVEMAGLPKIQVEKAKPIGESVLFSVVPQALALGGEPIVIEGKLYGYADPRFKCWVMNYESSILVWDKYRREVYTVKMDTDVLREKK